MATSLPDLDEGLRRVRESVDRAALACARLYVPDADGLTDAEIVELAHERYLRLDELDEADRRRSQMTVIQGGRDDA